MMLLVEFELKKEGGINVFHGMTFYSRKDFKSTPDPQTIRRRTWEDWHIIPTTMPIIARSHPKTNYQSTYAAQGGIDMTDAVLGYPVYERREGSWEFSIINSYVDINGQTVRTLQSDLLITKMMEIINGQPIYMILDDDPNFYYYGRFWIEDVKRSETLTGIVIKYSLNPWKISTTPLEIMYSETSKYLYLWNDIYLGTDRYEAMYEVVPTGAPGTPQPKLMVDVAGTIGFYVPGHLPSLVTLRIVGSATTSTGEIAIIYNGQAHQAFISDGGLTYEISMPVTDRYIQITNLAVNTSITLVGDWGDF